MKTIILELITMSFPVILAAVLHMILAKGELFKTLAYPLDHYKKINGKRIFGDNKTYRGAIVMMFFSIIFTVLHYVVLGDSRYNLLNYDSYSALFYGVLFGLGYILGELPNSFMKRQIGIQPGKAKGFFALVIDQIDSVAVIMFLLIPFSGYTLTHAIVGIVFFGIVHLTINYLLYITGVRKESV